MATKQEHLLMEEIRAAVMEMQKEVKETKEALREMQPTVEGAVEIVQAWRAVKTVGGWAKWILGVVASLAATLAAWYNYIRQH